jgi:hypothetical protein
VPSKGRNYGCKSGKYHQASENRAQHFEANVPDHAARKYEEDLSDEQEDPTREECAVQVNEPAGKPGRKIRRPQRYIRSLRLAANSR